MHKTLKELYALEFGGKTEEKIDGKICDIFIKEKNEIIEIQTGSFANLRLKIAALIDAHKIRLIFPIVTQKLIVTEDSEGNAVSKRKSPKKQNIYSIFRELTSLYPWLLHKNFTLEVLFVSATEKRVKTKKAVQSANKRRRFLRDWLKTDKVLNIIEKKMIFAKKTDYTGLLPQAIYTKKNVEFSVNDIIEASTEKIKKNEAQLFVWVLNKVGMIEITKKTGNAKYYRIVD